MRNVLLVASSDIAWPTLRALLRAMPEVQIVGEAFTPADALDMATAREPDVVVVPAEPQGSSSLDLVRALHDRYPRAAIVVLASRFHASDLAELAQAGVRSYLLWPDMDIDVLERCLSVAILGDVMLGSALVGQAFLESALGRPSSSAAVQLTPRERSILELLAEGCTDKEIAVRLGISPSTVGSHVQNLCTKLGAKTRFGLAVSAVAKGLVPTG